MPPRVDESFPDGIVSIIRAYLNYYELRVDDREPEEEAAAHGRYDCSRLLLTMRRVGGVAPPLRCRAIWAGLPSAAKAKCHSLAQILCGLP